MTASIGRRVHVPRGPRAPWLTVAVMALLVAYADGFIVTSLQGAVGAVSRARGPFGDWLRLSTLLLPLFAGSVLWGFKRGQRRYGPEVAKFRPVLGAVLIISAAATVIGVAALVASSAYDYQLQSAEIQSKSLSHSTHSVQQPNGSNEQSGHHTDGACDSTCDAKRTTLAVHITGVTYASGLTWLANVVLVGWVAAIRGGRLNTALRF